MKSGEKRTSHIVISLCDELTVQFPHQNRSTQEEPAETTCKEEIDAWRAGRVQRRRGSRRGYCRLGFISRELMSETSMWCLWPDWTHSSQQDVSQIHGFSGSFSCRQYPDGKSRRLRDGFYAKRCGSNDAARTCCADQLQDQDWDWAAAVRCRRRGFNDNECFT